MNDLEPFESPKILIDGAKASIDEFEPLCGAFVQNCTYDVINYTDPKTGEHVVKLRFHQRVPPRMRLPVSHAVNDLRHSLDQALVDAAILLGCRRVSGIHFPFGKTAKNLDDEVKSRCQGVDPDLTRFIRSFDAHYGEDDLLYGVGSLAGPNKHQQIIRISLNSGGMVIGATGRPWSLRIDGATGAKIGTNKWNDLRNELEFMRFGKGSEGNIDARPAIEIVIGTGEPPLSGPAVSILRTFASKVEGIALGIEAEARRILASRS